MSSRISIIIPAKNESAGLSLLLPNIKERYPSAEVIVVDDGSTDDTAKVCRTHGAQLVSHPYSIGNGAAVKSGVRVAQGEILVFVDGDAQHDPADIDALLQQIEKGYDMAVGARNFSAHSSRTRWFGNSIYNTLASWIVSREIPDLTSGFRAVKAKKFREFLYLLPNGFSYPTTITMAFFRAGYTVVYVPITTKRRAGSSHIRMMRDGLRFLIIIFRIGTLYSPLKIFLPASLLFFLLGIGYYMHTYLTQGRFTNMSALLFIASIVVFLIGLVSEQITSLIYRKDN